MGRAVPGPAAPSSGNPRPRTGGALVVAVLALLLGRRRAQEAGRKGLTLPFRLLVGWFAALPALAVLLGIVRVVFCPGVT